MITEKDNLASGIKNRNIYFQETQVSVMTMI